MRLALALTLLAVLAGCGGEPAPARPRFDSYVALGDSYTSGPGIVPVEHAACGLSGRNYPHLLADRLGVRDFVDASCGGSTTAHLTTPQTVAGTTVPPQLARVGPDTDLVTLGSGLNNHGASSLVLFACGQYRQPARCRHLLGLPPRQLRLLAHRLASDVGAAIDQIRRRAPDALVVLVGYPSLAEPDDSCPQVWSVEPGVQDTLHVLLRALNEEYRAIAGAKEATYADVFTPSTGHGICSEDPWVAGDRPVPERGLQLHPLDTAMRAVAGIVEDAVLAERRD